MKNTVQLGASNKKLLRQHRIKRFSSNVDDAPDEMLDHCTSYCETQDCDSKYSKTKLTADIAQDQRVISSNKIIKQMDCKTDNYQRLSPRFIKSKKMCDIALKTLDSKNCCALSKITNNCTAYFRMAKVMLKKSNQGLAKQNTANLNLKILGDRYSSIESLKSISERYSKNSFISSGSPKNINKEIEMLSVNPMSMHKSFESKVLVLNRNFENVDDELQNSVVNVPIVSEKSAKKLSTLIEPMKKATFREQIMPFELSPKPDTEKSIIIVNNKKNFELAPKQQTSTKYGSSNFRPKISNEFEYRREIIQKESRIWELEMKINSMQKENTDLRLSLNYFMQLQFHK